MSDELEDRLRRALAARAEVVSSTDLSPALPPPAAHRTSRAPFVVSGIALAAAATAASVFVLAGGWRPGGQDTAQPGLSTVSSAPVTTPSGRSTATGRGTPSATGAPGPSDVGPAGSVAATPTSTRTAVSGLAPCAASAISAYVLPDTTVRPHGGGMNHQGATIGLTNTGTSPCRLTGYPGVAMLTGTTMVSADPNTRGSTYYAKDPGPSSLGLLPGGSAFAEVSWTSADGVKPATTVDTLQVILPDQRTKLLVPLRTVLGGDRTLTVTALSVNPLPLNGSGG